MTDKLLAVLAIAFIAYVFFPLLGAIAAVLFIPAAALLRALFGLRL